MMKGGFFKTVGQLLFLNLFLAGVGEGGQLLSLNLFLAGGGGGGGRSSSLRDLGISSSYMMISQIGIHCEHFGKALVRSDQQSR